MPVRLKPNTPLFTLLALALLFSRGAFSADPLIAREALQPNDPNNPGVPVWPVACDCLTLAFGDPDGKGQRQVRFTVGAAAGYYSADSSVNAGKGMRNSGPRRPAGADADFPEFSAAMYSYGDGLPSLTQAQTDVAVEQIAYTGDWSERLFQEAPVRLVEFDTQLSESGN